MSTSAIEEEVRERGKVGADAEVSASKGTLRNDLMLLEVQAIQRVGDYRIHEATEVIPSLHGAAFEDLVNEIATNGQRDVVVIDGDVIIEGVDTVRAVGVLKDRGIDIDLQAVPWQPRPGQTVPEFLAYKHLQGPRFTDAQRAQIAADLLPLIEKERAAVQESARIKPGEVRNPLGINKRAASGEGGSETCPPSDAKARNKAKVERSTVGQIAKLANVTTYAAMQAVKIKRYAASEIIVAVKAGRAKPKDVVADIDEVAGGNRPAGKPLKVIDHPFQPTTPLQYDLLKGWVHLRDSRVAIDERAKARDDMRALLDAEEAAEKAALGTGKGGRK